jgi:transcription elongation GreA/GreB family factor
MSDVNLWTNGLLLKPPAFARVEPDYQPLIDAGDWDGLENLLMERLDSAPERVELFLPAYRAFVKKRESGRLETMLQLHVDCLTQRQNRPAEIGLLQAVLSFWPECGFARDNLLRHLAAAYHESPHYAMLLKHFKLRESQGLEPLRQFELWLRYDEGRAVYMETKGVGRVREVSPNFGVVRILFESGEQVSLRTDEAERLAQPLPKEHFLARKLTEPGQLRQLAESDPAGLLQQFFASVKRTLSLAELREMLCNIISEDQWSGWWAKARQDRRVTVGTGTKPQISWSETADDAASAIASQFAQAPAHEKLDMLRKHGSRSPQLTATMLAGLTSAANAGLAANPGLSLEIALTLEKYPSVPEATLAFSLTELLRRPDSAQIIAAVKDRLLRRKATQLLAQARQDWPEVYIQLLLTETDTQSLTMIYEALRDHGADGCFEQLIGQTLADPLSSPRFYLWLCREMASRPELKARANWSFLSALLKVLDNSAFRGHQADLRALFDLGEAADYALVNLEQNEARRLLDILVHTTELEEYRRDRLRKEIYLHHPSLQEKKESAFYVTAEAIEKKREEFEKLVRVDIPHNSLEIKRTREYGDLRENFEYHAARARQEMLSSRAKTLHDELISARKIEPANVDTSKISIGTAVTLREAAGPGVPLTIAILGPWDSDPARNILTYTSEAAGRLLGEQVGATVEFNEKSWMVERIEVWREEKSERGSE